MNDLKRRFIRCAHAVVPGFRLPESDKPLYNDIFQWCIMNPAGRYNPSKGLFIWGDIGVGKTSILRIVKEFCRIPGIRPPKSLGVGYELGMPYSFAIISVHRILSDYQRRAESLDDHSANPYLAIDDIGAEAKEVNRFGTVKNVIDELIQLRYERFCADREFTTHATANIAPDQIASHYSERTFDRCIEMFNFVEMRGYSRRQ